MVVDLKAWIRDLEDDADYYEIRRDDEEAQELRAKAAYLESSAQECERLMGLLKEIEEGEWTTMGQMRAKAREAAGGADE